MSNGTNTVSELLEPELMTESSTMPPSLAMSEHSLVQDVQAYIEGLRMSLLVDSPVSHLVQPAECLGQMTSETCGLQPLNAFAWYDQATHCWRTFQACLLVDILEPFSDTWPRQGMTVDGQFYPLAPLVRHIHGKDCSCWPTPIASESTGGGSAKEAERSMAGIKRKSGANITLRAKDLYLLKYGTQPGAIFYEWLMGWAPRWTGLEPLAMDKFQQWLQQHGIYSVRD